MAKSKKGLRIGKYRITPLGIGTLVAILLIIAAIVVMLVLNPRRYCQGAVQQLCKCQGAQEMISLVPKAPWMVYCR